MLKRFAGLVLMGGLSLSPILAQVVVHVAPPHVIVENRGVRPSRNHVWVSGYHRWDGNAYAWNAGRWEQPPPGHSRWVAHHWVHQGGGWVLVDGRWR
jgi:hypothetical protein